MEAIPWATINLDKLTDDIIDKFNDFPWSWYDGIPDPNPDEVTLADCSISLCMGSNFRQDTELKDWDTLKDTLKPRIDSLLSGFRCDVQLWDQSQDVDKFLTEFKNCLQGVVPLFNWGVAKLSKTLHRKRPALIPMLESRVQNAYLFGPLSEGMWPNPNDEDRVDEKVGISRAEQALDDFVAELKTHLVGIEDVIANAHKKAPHVVPRSLTPVRCLESLVYWRNTSRGAHGRDG